MEYVRAMGPSIKSPKTERIMNNIAIQIYRSDSASIVEKSSKARIKQAIENVPNSPFRRVIQSATPINRKVVFIPQTSSWFRLILSQIILRMSQRMTLSKQDNPNVVCRALDECAIVVHMTGNQPQLSQPFV